MLLNRPILKEHMQYCLSHPEEMSKLSKLKAQITEVKGIMMDNIEKVYDTKPNDTHIDAFSWCMFSALVLVRLSMNFLSIVFLRKNWKCFHFSMWERGRRKF